MSLGDCTLTLVREAEIQEITMQIFVSQLFSFNLHLRLFYLMHFFHSFLSPFLSRQGLLTARRDQQQASFPFFVLPYWTLISLSGSSSCYIHLSTAHTSSLVGPSELRLGDLPGRGSTHCSRWVDPPPVDKQRKGGSSVDCLDFFAGPPAMRARCTWACELMHANAPICVGLCMPCGNACKNMHEVCCESLCSKLPYNFSSPSRNSDLAWNSDYYPFALHLCMIISDYSQLYKYARMFMRAKWLLCIESSRN